METPLQYTWTFWVNYVIQSSYEIEQIISISTVQDFWNAYLQLRDVMKLKKGGISIFKNGIKPAWEDPNNQDGYAISIKLFPTESDTYLFDKIILAVVGGSIEQLLPSQKLCGLYVLTGTLYVTVSLWFSPNKNGLISDPELDILSRLLEINKENFIVKEHPKIEKSD